MELRGIEPLSENNLTGLSPGAVCYLHSLAEAGTNTLIGLGRVMMHGASQSFPAARSPLKSHPSPARGPSGEDGRLIRQPEQQYCCQLILKNCPVYGGQAPPPAYPASLPPSKPVQPRVRRRFPHAGKSFFDIKICRTGRGACRVRGTPRPLCRRGSRRFSAR